MTSLDLAPTTPRPLATLLTDLRDGQVAGPGIGPVGTGFLPLDPVLDGGFLPGDVVLIAGQPAAGKTICGLQWARAMAGAGRPVTFACFEHDEGSLLTRLAVQELAIVGCDVEPIERRRARTLVRDLLLGLITLDDAVTGSPLIESALSSLDSCSRRLHLLRASAQRTTPDELEDLARGMDAGGVLFVDYLQKLPVPDVVSLEDRFYRSVELLKEMAVTHHVTVVAVSAVSEAGLRSDRVRLSQLRGSDALAHECDVAIVLNQKVTATADRHLKYDLTQIDEARRRTVFSVEKNRRGEVDVHVEFVKDFSNFRFHPQGRFVTESLEES